jgi:hypothetical protein
MLSGRLLCQYSFFNMEIEAIEAIVIARATVKKVVGNVKSIIFYHLYFKSVF